METKRITVGYIASTKGIKSREEPTIWYNPVETIKDEISSDLKDKVIEVTISKSSKDSFEFNSFKVIEETKQEVVEEMIGEEPVDLEEIPDGCEGPGIPENAPVPNINTVVEKPEIKGMSPIEGLFKALEQHSFDEEYFNKLNARSVEIDKKGKLSYSSWAESWSELKKVHPSANFKIHEWNGLPYIENEHGALTKVSVTVQGLTHTIWLPVMNNLNKAVKGATMDLMLINKTIMRALTKAIALHGLGLFLYRGEDLPEEPTGTKK